MSKPKILAFSGSTRNGSLNSRLATIVANELRIAGGEVNLISLSDYPLPIYDGDFEKENSVPEQAHQLHELFRTHQGIFIACPEYNGGYTPLLKNTIDWISRIKVEGEQSVFKNRIFALGAATPGGLGGIRGLIGIRPVLEVALGAMVLPDQLIIPKAGDVFEKSDLDIPEQIANRINTVAKIIVTAVRRFNTE